MGTFSDLKISPRQTELTLTEADEAAFGALENRRVVLLASALDRIRMYAREDIPLSTILPTLTHVGIQVRSQTAFTAAYEKTTLSIYEFEVAEFEREHVQLLDDAFNAVVAEKADNDDLNKLITARGLSWRSVVVFRAYLRYLGQLGLALTAAEAAHYMLAHGKITDLFLEFFETGFDPELTLDRQEREKKRAEIAREIEVQLSGISDLKTDRFLRALLEVMRATVRTNFYQNKETVAFKLRPQDISFAPLPRPLWEIWVYSSKVEGTHLRFGMVSRGGLRWSDRPDDFRTEVLGLVKAQRVKNSVIIPNGSKGGFFPKGLPDRDAEKELYAQMGVDAYKLFIGSLLDVTDNLVVEDGKERIVQPERVVILDEPDHYLVVAADKGTATFSDTANALSLERGFWLGDAFASGGSVGFDHKEMGITARGAWESVKRHFASIGRDSQTEDFTVVGIGGMAGDVFGNGVLLSTHIRLIAAFDSRHIFVDPNPDTEVSFAERQRLFNLPRAYWTDYNRDLISSGGGIFNRTDKSIPVSDPMRQALGLEEGTTALTPHELIRAIIAAPVDLLYTGGTGTYVRASDETDADVRDRSNDPMRISAPELRARVISEGGNLGLTQRARIEAARHGVLVNTDAVDNSAGVETSDHEVNLKILVDRLVAAGEIDRNERAGLIEAQVDEVAGQVLESNINQNILLQAERNGTRPTNSAAARFIAFLEKNAGLDREVEFLPSDQELMQRRAAGERLTSPELSVLTAYSKLWLTQTLLDQGFGEDRWLEPVLRHYFPSAISEKYGSHFWEHPLRREIIATRVANEIVDTAGIVFVFRVVEETGATAATVARAFLVIREIYSIATVMQQLRDLSPKTDPEIWRLLIHGIQRFIDRAVRKVVQEGTLADAEARGQVDGVMERMLSHYSQVGALVNLIPSYLGGFLEARLNSKLEQVQRWGVPQEIGNSWARVWEEVAILDIVDVAAATNWSAQEVAPLYFALYQRYNVSIALVAITDLPRTGLWDSIARASLRTDLYETIIRLTRHLIAFVGTAGVARPSSFAEALEIVKAWEQSQPVLTSNFRRSENLTEILRGYVEESGTADFATIAVAVRNLREIAD